MVFITNALSIVQKHYANGNYFHELKKLCIPSYGGISMSQSSLPSYCCVLVSMTELMFLLCSMYTASSLVDLKTGDSVEYCVVSSMSQVIINAIAQNSLTIAEAVSKEAFIPADIVDQILTADYTPLQRAEILCKALMEEIERDAKVFYKFLALLSNLGLNRPLIITLKNFLPSFSE